MNNLSIFSIFNKALKDLLHDLPELEKNKRSISAGTIQDENHFKTDYHFSMEFLEGIKDKKHTTNNRINDKSSDEK